MTDASNQAIPGGFALTCWRGLSVCHPADWEPALLSGPDEPGHCAWVDRRFERLQVQWRPLPRPPDLRRMYEDLAKTFARHPTSPLSDVPGWTGLVRQEKDGHIVHAGRFFPEAGWLVQAVVVWPGRRDERIERDLLTSIRAGKRAGPVLWQALGLAALVPAEFELVNFTTQVGQVVWDFRRTGRPAPCLRIERTAMPQYWMKAQLKDWLAGQLPAGFRVTARQPVECAGHEGHEVRSLRSNPAKAILHLATSRLDRAWLCPQEERVYHVSSWRRGRGRIEWPRGLVIHCHGTEVRIGP